MLRVRLLLFAVALSVYLFPQLCDAASGVTLPALAASELDEKLQGLVLIEELNCLACHGSDSSFAESSKKAPRLAEVGRRVNPYYLEQFIQSPQGHKPGTTMPNVMGGLPEKERQQAAKAIAHYLLSLNRSAPFAPQPIDAVAAGHGETLFHSVGCVACHSPRNAQGVELLPESSTPLGELEKKYSTSSLAEFLRAPHKVRPSGRMPDLRLSDRDAQRIAHYLLRKTELPGHLKYTLLSGRVWEGLDENVTPERAGHVDDFNLASLPQIPNNSALIYEGFLNIETAGEYTFYLQLNGGQLWLNDEEVIGLSPSNRREVKKAEGKAKLKAGPNKIKFIYFHTGKEPRLGFEMAGPGVPRGAIDSSRLSISESPIAPYEPYKLDNSLVSAGKKFFSELGCANCHDDLKAERTPAPKLSELNGEKGCLGPETGRWPQYLLSEEQKGLIRPLLATLESIEQKPEEIVNHSLVTFNCIACHDREGLGGVSLQRNEYFVGTKEELGNEGRIPPPLTHVGAKLQTSWIKEVMLNGKQQREYLAATMPQFGEANVGHLVELFEKVDSLEEVAFEKIDDIGRYKEAGHQLVGATGFSCIACHDFNGQKASGPGALEIIDSTARLKKDWFYYFMLDPARFRPNTIMPAAWPGGHVFKKEILDGDAKKQIESIWVYLQDGSRAKNPIGLSRKSPILRVTDETLICRGRGVAGYRGIGVGYPGRISLAFDSEEMNLRQLWKGEFASVNPGSFSPRGQDRIEFPPGIPFHRLASLDDNWPYKRKTDYLFPQDHGYQFQGYQLDEEKRPTFLYQYGQISVREFFEDLPDENENAFFRRTLTFDAPAAAEKFYFRAATGKKIEKQAEASFKADRLTVTIAGPERGPKKGIVREGEPQELLIPLELPKGESTLILEYKW